MYSDLSVLISEAILNMIGNLHYLPFKTFGHSLLKRTTFSCTVEEYEYTLCYTYSTKDMPKVDAVSKLKI